VTPVVNRRGWGGRAGRQAWAARSWRAGATLPAGRDPCRRSKPAQIFGGGSRPIPAPASRSFRFHLQAHGAVNGFAPIAECALQLAGLHDPLFTPLQHDELDELGHLVKSAKQPNQKDDRNRDSDQPQQKTAAHDVLLFNTLHRLNALPMTKFPRPMRADEFLADLAGHPCPAADQPALGHSMKVGGCRVSVRYRTFAIRCIVGDALFLFLENLFAAAHQLFRLRRSLPAEKLQRLGFQLVGGNEEFFQLFLDLGRQVLNALQLALAVGIFGNGDDAIIADSSAFGFLKSFEGRR
jgi:hypothetical protein